MSAKPHELVEAVVDEASFVAFITALAQDWEDERQREAAEPSHPCGPGANAWENGSIGAFLEAAAAWADASKHGLQRYSVPSNPWRRAAEILLAGKLYE